MERQDDDIFHPLKGRSATWTGEALGDDDPDPTVCVSRIPIALPQDLAVESRKAESVLVAVSIDVRAEIYGGDVRLRGLKREVSEAKHTYDIRP